MRLYLLIFGLKSHVMVFVHCVRERWPAANHVEQIHSLKRSHTCLEVLVSRTAQQDGSSQAGINASHVQAHASNANLQVICVQSVTL
jgi:hypothetical protein